nr:nodulation protein [Candidatus Poribacteria bacterium]
KNVTNYAAQQLADGKVIAWFQGAMEAGPRALGNRSILADPRDVRNRDRVNEKVKFRELWRPFCPSVLADKSDEYFMTTTQCPYMINTFRVSKKTELVAPAIVHVDGTARPQFVTQSANRKFYQLIQEFFLITGVPMLLNTSMNIKGEPICCTPDDALQLFFATDIDVLVLGNSILEKQAAR